MIAKSVSWPKKQHFFGRDKLHTMVLAALRWQLHPDWLSWWRFSRMESMIGWPNWTWMMISENLYLKRWVKWWRESCTAEEVCNKELGECEAWSRKIFCSFISKVRKPRGLDHSMHNRTCHRVGSLAEQKWRSVWGIQISEQETGESGMSLA